MLSDHCPVCLSCLWCWCIVAGWIKMKLGMEVGLGPGHTVLDGETAPKNAAQHTFWPIYCGQMAGWIKMPLGTEVSLGPGHIVLNGDPLHTHRGTAAPSIFGPCLLWPNGWMDQDATWYIGRPSFPPQKKRHSSPLFGPCLLWQTIAHFSYCWRLVLFIFLFKVSCSTLNWPLSAF